MDNTRGREEWAPFLERWSGEWVDGHDPESDAPLAPEVAKDRWLGFAPAAEADIAAAEARLGRRLPPSLREFLQVTDGWRDAGCFVYRLAGTADLQWLKDTDDKTWIEVYDDLAGLTDGEDPEEDDDEPEDDEDEDEEDFEVQEALLLRRTLRLSLEGDACVLLLDPDDVDEDGEWAAYRLASWSGQGPERHDSFYDLMYAEYVSFHGLRKPPGATRDHWAQQVEQARQATLGGEVDAPLEVLARAREFGSERAEVLAMQLKAMLGDWQHEITNLVWHRAGDDDLLRSPLFAAELLPLLIRQDQLAARYDLRPLERLKEVAPPDVQAVVATYEAAVAAPDFRPTFGNPEFDAAVHAVLARDATDDAAAYQGLRDALPLWRPLTDDHIAPVSLLAHPTFAELLTPERGRELLETARG